jgi:outer membrane receptor for ferrienterochelin and colicin
MKHYPSLARPTSLNRSALALTLAICAGSAAAQSAAPSPAASAALKDELKWLQAEKISVSTASLRSESLDRAPATVRVITQRQIHERGYRTIEDVLKGLPGVDVLNHVHTDSKNIVTMRGVHGNNKFIILQDGIRISGPTGESDLQISENFPLYMARQVEVLSGPASALYGADAFSGVINIITEAPTEAGTVRGNLAGGSYSTYQLEFVAAKRFSDAVAVTFGGHHQQSQGAPLSEKYFSDFHRGNDFLLPGDAPYASPYRSFSTYAKVDLWENLTVGWRQSFLSTSSADGGLPGGAFSNLGINPYDGPPENQSLLANAFATYKFTPSERLSGQVQVNYSRYERLPQSGFNNFFTGYTQAYKYALGERYQIEGHGTLEVGEKHSLTAGLSADYSYVIPAGADLSRPYDTSRSPSQQGFTYLGTAIPLPLFEESSFNGGGFLQAQTDWTDRLSSTVGVRVDYNTEYGEAVTPRAGLVFQQSPETTWKALYGRSYLAPSAHRRFENFGTVTAPVTTFYKLPNPDLKPERLQTLELSLNQQLTPDFTAGLTGFYTLLDDNIRGVTTTVDNTTFLPGITIDTSSSYQNVGTLVSRGVELTLDHTWKSDLTRLNVWGSFTYMNGQLKNQVTGVRYDLPYTSTELLKLGATWNYNDRVIVTPSVNFNGPQAGFTTAPVAGFEGFGQRVPSFYVVNLYAELRTASQNLSGFIRVDNLLDARYYNASQGGDAYFFRTPQDSRQIVVGLKGKY